MKDVNSRNQNLVDDDLAYEKRRYRSLGPIARPTEFVQSDQAKRVPCTSSPCGSWKGFGPGSDEFRAGSRETLGRFFLNRKMLADCQILEYPLSLAHHPLCVNANVFQTFPVQGSNDPGSSWINKNTIRLPVVLRRIQSKTDDSTKDSVDPIETKREPEICRAKTPHEIAPYRMEVAVYTAGVKSYVR